MVIVQVTMLLSYVPTAAAATPTGSSIVFFGLEVLLFFGADFWHDEPHSMSHLATAAVTHQLPLLDRLGCFVLTHLRQPDVRARRATFD